MYAIVKTGGKQYRVERGQSLLVERLPVQDGASVSLQPLLFVDGSTVLHGAEDVSVEARVVGHERGPKLRVVKFKPKRGYKRRTGHRQELTRIEVTEISVGGVARTAEAAPETPRPVAAGPASVASEVSMGESAGSPETAVESVGSPSTVETGDGPADAPNPPATTTEEDNDGA